jgi:hypothetical protein
MHPILIVSTYAFRKYFHDVPTKNGSLLMASIAQNPIGIRTQFRPAAKIVLDVNIVWEGNSTELTSYIGEVLFGLDNLSVHKVP